MSETPDIAGSSGKTARIWDLPVRLFHWTLVALIVTAWAIAEFGSATDMWLHMLAGYAILALVLFRIFWGFFGSRHARFTDFVRSPLTVIAYLRAMAGKRPAPAHTAGHNPMGGYSVLALLVLVLAQAVTGLFVNDDIMNEGPLASSVPSSVASFMYSAHHLVFTALQIVIVVHLAAILFYRFAKGENLVKAMITGKKDGVAPGIDDSGSVFSPILAVLLLLFTAAGVAALVQLA